MCVCELFHYLPWGSAWLSSRSAADPSLLWPGNSPSWWTIRTSQTCQEVERIITLRRGRVSDRIKVRTLNCRWRTALTSRLSWLSEWWSPSGPLWAFSGFFSRRISWPGTAWKPFISTHRAERCFRGPGIQPAVSPYQPLLWFCAPSFWHCAWSHSTCKTEMTLL